MDVVVVVCERDVGVSFVVVIDDVLGVGPELVPAKSIVPAGSGRVTIQSCRSKGGSVLNVEGKIFPAQRCIRALGDNSPGLPSNLANWACSPLPSQPSPSTTDRTYPGNLFSHFITSSHARSFRKLCIATTISILSSGVSHPFLTRAL